MTPSGSSANSICGRGEPASISSRNRCSRSWILAGCRSASGFSNAAGSRFRRSGTAIDCKSRMPSGVSRGEPARTRVHHGCWRNDSANCGANSSSLSASCGLAEEREGQFADLSEIAVVDFQAFDRLEAARKKIEHLGVELHPRDENENGERGARSGDTQPDRAAPLRDKMADGMEGMNSERADVRVSAAQVKSADVKLSAPDVKLHEPFRQAMIFSRKATQPRKRSGAFAVGPAQRPRASGPSAAGELRILPQDEQRQAGTFGEAQFQIAVA